MRTFLVAVNLPEKLWGDCLALPDLSLRVSNKIEELKIDELNFAEDSGFDVWKPEDKAGKHLILAIPLTEQAMHRLSGWDEENDSLVIEFICSEIVKDLP